MLYADRFSGHMSNEDIRTPLTGAATCTWPTVPPHKYFFGCPSGEAAFSVLRLQGLLMVRVTPGEGHDFLTWQMFGQVLPFNFAQLEKQVSPDRSHCTYTLTLGAVFTGSPAIKTFRFNPGRCNVDLVVGDFSFPNPIFGNAGADSRIMQVEYDKILPPDGWP